MQQIILRKIKEENGTKIIEEKVLHTIEEPATEEEQEYTIGFPRVLPQLTKEENIVPIEEEKPVIDKSTIYPELFKKEDSLNDNWQPPSNKFKRNESQIKLDVSEMNTPAPGRQKLDSLGLKSGSPDRIKLNPEKVKEMRRLSAKGMQLDAIAEKFGVSKSTAYAAINFISWSHVK